MCWDVTGDPLPPSPIAQLLLFGARASSGVQERSGRKATTVAAGHSAPVVAVAFRADSRWLATGSMDKTAKLWEVATGRELRTLRSHAGWVTSVAFSPDGRWLVTGSRDNTAKLWDATTGEETKTFRHPDWVSTVAVSPDGQLLACQLPQERMAPSGYGR